MIQESSWNDDCVEFDACPILRRKCYTWFSFIVQFFDFIVKHADIWSEILFFSSSSTIRLIYHLKLNKLWKSNLCCPRQILCGMNYLSIPCNNPYVHFTDNPALVWLYWWMHVLFISLGHWLASSHSASLNQWLVFSHRTRTRTPPCPWDFINIISSSRAADIEQRAIINYSSLVLLARCLGIHTARSLLCRFRAVHDLKTPLSCPLS